MKKIKRKPQAAGAKKEFSATHFFYSQRSKIVRLIGFSIVISLCVTLMWLWIRHREIEASLLLSQAETNSDYKEIASRFSFTKTKPLAMVALARELFNQNKYNEAISVYKEFIKRYPRHNLVASASIGLAYCYEETRDIKEAETIFKRIKQKFPNTIWAKEAEEGYKRVSVE